MPARRIGFLLWTIKFEKPDVFIANDEGFAIGGAFSLFNGNTIAVCIALGESINVYSTSAGVFARYTLSFAIGRAVVIDVANAFAFSSLVCIAIECNVRIGRRLIAYALGFSVDDGAFLTIVARLFDESEVGIAEIHDSVAACANAFVIDGTARFAALRHRFRTVLNGDASVGAFFGLNRAGVTILERFAFADPRRRYVAALAARRQATIIAVGVFATDFATPATRTNHAILVVAIGVTIAIAFAYIAQFFELGRASFKTLMKHAVERHAFGVAIDALDEPTLAIDERFVVVFAFAIGSDVAAKLIDLNALCHVILSFAFLTRAAKLFFELTVDAFDDVAIATRAFLIDRSTALGVGHRTHRFAIAHFAPVGALRYSDMTIDAFDARIAIAKTTDAADAIFRTRGTIFIGI